GVSSVRHTAVLPIVRCRNVVETRPTGWTCVERAWLGMPSCGGFFLSLYSVGDTVFFCPFAEVCT
ncbi:MAG: hypothetical protein JSW48_17040, partial [Betaproteobacteria bacterium]